MDGLNASDSTHGIELSRHQPASAFSVSQPNGIKDPRYQFVGAINDCCNAQEKNRQRECTKFSSQKETTKCRKAPQTNDVPSSSLSIESQAPRSSEYSKDRRIIPFREERDISIDPPKPQNNLPQLFNEAFWRQTNHTLRAGLINTTASGELLCQKHCDRALNEHMAATKPFFQENSSDHMVGGRELYSGAKQNSIDHALDGGLGGMESDEDFRDLVDMANFVPGRKGIQPGRDMDVKNVVRYTDENGNMPAWLRVYKPGYRPPRRNE